MAVHEGRIRQHPVGGAVGLQLAPVEDQDSLAEIQHEIEVVRGDDLRTGELAQNLQKLAARSRVEITGWFIQHEN